MSPINIQIINVLLFFQNKIKNKNDNISACGIDDEGAESIAPGSVQSKSTWNVSISMVCHVAIVIIIFIILFLSFGRFLIESVNSRIHWQTKQMWAISKTLFLITKLGVSLSFTHRILIFYVLIESNINTSLSLSF